jgi:uncharacterized protein YbjT (DUF2867 family)
MAAVSAVKIVIPGGAGQVGRILARHFHAHGHAVTVLSRNPLPAPWRVLAWDGLTPGAWIEDLERSDVCINLAGRSVPVNGCRARVEPQPRRVIEGMKAMVNWAAANAAFRNLELFHRRR